MCHHLENCNTCFLSDMDCNKMYCSSGFYNFSQFFVTEQEFFSHPPFLVSHDDILQTALCKVCKSVTISSNFDICRRLHFLHHRKVHRFTRSRLFPQFFFPNNRLISIMVLAYPGACVRWWIFMMTLQEGSPQCRWNNALPALLRLPAPPAGPLASFLFLLALDTFFLDVILLCHEA